MRPWKPNPKQILQFNAIQRYIDAMGEQRSGKSEGFFQRLILKEIWENPGIKVLITRDTGTSLAFATLKHFLSLIEDQRCIKDILKKPAPLVQFVNGSEVYFIPYDDIQTTKTGGYEYGIILIEEAQRSSQKQWVYFDARISQRYGDAIGADGIRYRSEIKYNGLWTTRNPAGRGWGWQTFYRDHPLASLTKRNEQGDLIGCDPNYLALKFYRADNRENLQEKYVQAMENYPEHLRQKFLSAEENPMEGLVFPEFSRSLNVYNGPGAKDFTPPSHWKITGGEDFGFQTPTVYLPMATTEDGFCVFFDEYRQDHKTIGENCQGIREMLDKHIAKGCSPTEIAYIDPKTKDQHGSNEALETVYDQHRKHLPFLAPAKRMSVLDRIARKRELLKPDKDKKYHPISNEYREEGWPTVIFLPACEATIQEHEDWEFAEVRNSNSDGKEKPQQRSDHGIDGSDYALQTYFYDNGPAHPLTEALESQESKLRKHFEKLIEESLESKNTGRPVDGSVY
jgi:hypothetical protein